MADYALDTLALQNAAVHAVGHGSVANFNAQTGITALQCVHSAINKLWFRRRWRWRQASETLPLTINQSYIALSATYGRTLSLAGYPATNYRPVPVTLDQLNQIRQQTGLAGFDLYYAPSWTAQASVTASPIARLEIFPTPAATVTLALTHLYERRPPAVSGSTDLVDIPPQFFPVLDDYTRGFAKHRVIGDGAGAAEFAVGDALLQSLVDEDVMAQPFGTAVPGANQMLGDSSPDDRRFEPHGVTVTS